jgi:23S rRNA pseudouridine1911/1915/1917 synthase
VAKATHIPLPDGKNMAILYEDRSILAVDKPAGWILGPDDWQHTRRNLSLQLQDDVREGAFWARSRNLKFVRFIHRLDGPTSGVMLWAKSQGALEQYSRLFATRGVNKAYLAVTDGIPPEKNWRRRDAIGPEPGAPGRYRVDPEMGKEAETNFELLDVSGRQALVLAEPYSGRTHQIRLHLLASGCPVAGDELYGKRDDGGLGLRAIRLEFRDPFTKRPICIDAPVKDFCWNYGFRVPDRVREIASRRDQAPALPRLDQGSQLDESADGETALGEGDGEYPDQPPTAVPARRSPPPPRFAPRAPQGPAPTRRSGGPGRPNSGPRRPSGPR